MYMVKSTFDAVVHSFYIYVIYLLPKEFSQMKIANAVQLFKSGDNNYRPVSLLPQFSKVFEKLFHKRLSVFVEKIQL